MMNPLQESKASALFLGVEIGATKLQIALGNNKGELLHVIQAKVILEDGAEGILRWMKQKIPDLIAKETEFGSKVTAIGVGFGGVIETSSGRVLTSVQVKGWQDVKLKSWFEENFSLPAIILNDTVAGGYGEYACGSGAGTSHFFYTNIGSGIGGVFILDGQYYDGQGYGAAYFGHTFVPDWTADIPGAARKVEDLCSGWAIERRLRSEGYIPPSSLITELSNGKRAQVTCLMLSEAAHASDAFALAEIGRIAESFSIGLANVVNLINPECISIGGGVSNMGDILLNPIRQELEKRVFIAGKDRYKVVKCAFGDQAVLVGSILFARDELIK